MKKLLIILIVILLIFVGFTVYLSQKPVSKARFTVNGEIIKEFDLNENCVENFSSHGVDITIEIKDKSARVVHSDCPDKICVNTGYISNITQTAVCLPNKAVLEIIE